MHKHPWAMLNEMVQMKFSVLRLVSGTWLSVLLYEGFSFSPPVSQRSISHTDSHLPPTDSLLIYLRFYDFQPVMEPFCSISHPWTAHPPHSLSPPLACLPGTLADLHKLHLIIMVWKWSIPQKGFHVEGLDSSWWCSWIMRILSSMDSSLDRYLIWCQNYWGVVDTPRWGSGR